MANKKSTARISILISCAVLFLLITFSPTPFEAAQSRSEKKLSEIQKEIKSKKQLVEESIKREKSLSEQIDDINRSIEQKSQELETYDKSISHTKSEIDTLSKEISLIKGKMDSRRRHLKERLRTLYKQQHGGHALILISATDYQDLITKSKYISLLAYYDTRAIKKYNADIDEINSKKQQLEALDEQLRSNKELARKTRKTLEIDLVKKDKLLAMIRSKRISYEKKIQELEESSKKLQKMIKRMKMKKLPKSITGKGFKASKGRLPWPVKGRIVIPFGEYKDPDFNLTVFKNGIEIKPVKGEKPKAVAGGRVVYSDWFKGYGMLLIIDHGSGYHSLYGNLTEIFLNTGDIIEGGSVVGTIGNSRLLDYPTLYFEIRYKGKPVNPEKWLKRKSSSKKRIRIK
jgi:septal ring factor EnvC (AmiA/AmiB activator)